MSSRRWRGLAAGMVAILSIAPYCVGQKGKAHKFMQLQSPIHWVGTWAAAPEPVDNGKGPLGSADFTIREIVHTSLPGKVLRIVLSNEMGTQPLLVGGAQVALSSGGTAIVDGSSNALTFDGKSSVPIPAGAKILSDSVAMDLPFGSNLAISLFVPKQSIPRLTQHSYGDQSNYFAPGNQIGAQTLNQSTEVDSWHFLSAVDVLATSDSGAVVTLGDSITDGAVSKRSGNLRWPDDLARRLHAHAATSKLGVLNEGIGGNRILRDQPGDMPFPSALARFDRDVLSQSSVKYLLILEGINDIGLGTRPIDPLEHLSVDSLILGLKQLIERAHTHGIRVYVGTLMPDEGLTIYYSEAGESDRQALNAWIRSNKLADGIIDFDKAVRDPLDVKRLLPRYDGGDHIHPSDAGHQAMADAIDLTIFADSK